MLFNLYVFAYLGEITKFATK